MSGGMVSGTPSCSGGPVAWAALIDLRMRDYQSWHLDKGSKIKPHKLISAIVSPCRKNGGGYCRAFRSHRRRCSRASGAIITCCQLNNVLLFPMLITCNDSSGAPPDIRIKCTYRNEICHRVVNTQATCDEEGGLSVSCCKVG